MKTPVSHGQVDLVLQRVRSRARRSAGVAALAWAAVLVLGVLLVAWALSGPTGWRQGSAVPLALALTALAVLVAGAALAHVAVGRWLDERAVARAVERAAGLGDGVVLGSLELERRVPEGVSGALATRARGRVLGRIQDPPDRLGAEFLETAGRWQRPAWRLLVGIGVVLVAATALSPDRTRSAVAGLLRPLAVLAEPVLPALVVLPGDAQLPRGEVVEVVVFAGPREQVTLRWQALGDVAREVVLEVTGDTARIALPPLDAPLEYWADAPDGAVTDRYRIDPTDPLFVGTVSVEVVFPAYTGRFREEYRGDLPPLTVPQGTVLEIRGEVNRPLSDVRLLGEDGSEFQIPLAGAGFEGRFTPPHAGTWRWRILGSDGSVPSVPPGPVTVDVVPDSVPELAFTWPARDTVLPIDLRQQLELQARDDYGLRDVQLVVRRLGAAGAAAEPVVQHWAAEGTRGILLRPMIDLSTWGLLPGDSVAYRAEAIEVGPFAKQAVTREWILRVPLPDELRHEAAEELDEAAARIDSLVQEAERLARELRERELEAEAEQRRAESARGNQTEETADVFERREEMTEALDRQESIVEATDSLRAELETMAEAMEDAGVSDPGLREDLAELEELLSQVSSEEMRERLEELRARQQEMTPAEMSDALEQMAADQEEMQARLEESLDRFRQAAVEQDFRAVNEEARELASEERRLAEALEQGTDPETAADRQQAAMERADSLGARVERLAERLEELGEVRTAEEMAEVRESVEAAREAVQRSEQAARRGDRQEAAERAEEAASEMDEVTREMEAAREEMEQQRQDDFQRAAGRAAEDALALARRQSDLRDQMAATVDPALRADEGALVVGLQRLAENLSVAAAAAGADPRALLTEVGRAMDRIGAVVSTLDGPPSQMANARASADAAIEALNSIALAALDMASGESGGQDQADGQGDASEELRQAADQQAQVNRETQAMMSMQLQNQGEGSQMQEVAEAQRRIAGELGEMADDPGAAEQALGDLPALAEAARMLAEELEQGRLQPETLERQRELFHRLLDAGRGLEREEESEEREAERPGSYEQGGVAPLGADALRVFPFTPPPASVLQQLPPAQRHLILEYFQRLNRGTTGTGGVG